MTRVLLGIGIALVLGLVLAALSDDGSFGRSFVVSGYVVGTISPLCAFAGHSPAIRSGTLDPFYSSFFVKLVPVAGARYSQARLSESAVFALTGITLIVLSAAIG